MNDYPLVSIIVPSYNHEKYIVDCLESIKNQTYSSIELLITDDCSNDNTYGNGLAWCNENSGRFARCEIKRNESNMGVCATLNAMIQNAKGQYIKVIASDDMLISDAIEQMVTWYEDNMEYDLVFSNGYFMKPDGKYPVTDEYKKGLIYSSDPYCGENMFGHLIENDYIAAPTIMVKKETFDSFGPYSNKYIFEDWEYLLRVAKTGRIGYVDALTVYYRNTPNSLSRIKSDDEGRKRYEKFFSDQLALLTEYLDDDQKYPKDFMNEAMAIAALIGAGKVVNLVMGAYKEGKVDLSLSSRIKYVMYKIHVAPYLLQLLRDMKKEG